MVTTRSICRWEHVRLPILVSDRPAVKVDVAMRGPRVVTAATASVRTSPTGTGRPAGSEDAERRRGRALLQCALAPKDIETSASNTRTKVVTTKAG